MNKYDYIHQATDDRVGDLLSEIVATTEDGRAYLENPEEALEIVNEAIHRLHTTKQREIIKLAKETRDAQKAYFKTRGHTELAQSKQLERRLDKAIDEYLNPPPPDLFS